jgi:hypothetical protein
LPRIVHSRARQLSGSVIATLDDKAMDGQLQQSGLQHIAACPCGIYCGRKSFH